MIGSIDCSWWCVVQQSLPVPTQSCTVKGMEGEVCLAFLLYVACIKINLYIFHFCETKIPKNPAWNRWNRCMLILVWSSRKLEWVFRIEVIWSQNLLSIFTILILSFLAERCYDQINDLREADEPKEELICDMNTKGEIIISAMQ